MDFYWGSLSTSGVPRLPLHPLKVPLSLLFPLKLEIERPLHENSNSFFSSKLGFPEGGRSY